MLRTGNSNIVFIPVSHLARRHGVLLRTLLAELKRDGVQTIVIGNQHQVIEFEFREWVLSKLLKKDYEKRGPTS